MVNQAGFTLDEALASGMLSADEYAVRLLGEFDAGCAAGGGSPQPPPAPYAPPHDAYASLGGAGEGRQFEEGADSV